MNTVVYCVCPDGSAHGFAEVDDGISGRAFCGTKHEFVRSVADDDKVCDVCFVESMVHLGTPRDEARAFLNSLQEEE